MSEPAKKKRRIRQAPQTVREQASQGPKQPRKRRVRGLFGVISRFLKRAGTIIGRILRPFRFLLRPFKTKPMRFIGRFLNKLLLVNYFRASWQELKLVTWPGRRETWQLTLAVFIFAVVFGVAVAITDYGLDKIFRKVLVE